MAVYYNLKKRRTDIDDNYLEGLLHAGTILDEYSSQFDHPFIPSSVLLAKLNVIGKTQMKKNTYYKVKNEDTKTF